MTIWDGLVDDAARFPPGDAPLDVAVAAHLARDAAYVGPLVVRDTDLPEVDSPRAGTTLSLAIVVTGGAGQVAGPAAFCHRRDGLTLAALEVALRDADDLAGNARRVVAAVDAAIDDGSLDDETPVFVELAHVANSGSWFAAADVVAERGLRLKLRTGGEQVPHPHALARWIDAALDRETPFKCTAGLHHAIAADGAHGFLNILLATLDLLDGTGVPAAVARLEEQDGATLAAVAQGVDLARARRWFTSFGSCDVETPWADLEELGLA